MEVDLLQKGFHHATSDCQTCLTLSPRYQMWCNLTWIGMVEGTNYTDNTLALMMLIDILWMDQDTEQLQNLLPGMGF